MDELFELLTLMQLKKLPQLNNHTTASAAAGAGKDAHSNRADGVKDAAVPHGAVVPVVLVDYVGFYQGFIQFVQVSALVASAWWQGRFLKDFPHCF
jgi:hypothetical protein